WNAAAFLAVALLVPLPQPPPPRPNAAAAGRLEDLKAEYQALEKEGAGDANLQKELERLEKEIAEGRFNAADWEAADSLHSRFGEKASEAAAELGRAAAAARELESALARNAGAEEIARDQEALERALQSVSSSPSEAANGQGKSGSDSSENASNTGG